MGAVKYLEISNDKLFLFSAGEDGCIMAWKLFKIKKDIESQEKTTTD